MTNKGGRPFDHYSRAFVLGVIHENPNITYYQLWKRCRANQISGGSFYRILKELEGKGQITRIEKEKSAKAISFISNLDSGIYTKPLSSIRLNWESLKRKGA